MEDRKSDGNGADADGFNWATGEEVAKFVRVEPLPEAAEVNIEACVNQPTKEELVNVMPVARLGSIECRKPKKQEWFRSHPVMFGTISVIRQESSGDYYLIDPALAHDLAEDMRETYIAACTSYEGALFLWPIMKPKSDGSGIQLYENDLADLSLSRQCWIRRKWLSGPKSYKVDQATTDRVPEWPEDTNIVNWVRRAFRGRFINNLDHQLVRQLRGDL